MTQQVKAEKGSNFRGKERVSGLLIAALAVALALVVMLQAVRTTGLSTSNLAQPASDLPAASRASALHLRNVAAVRVADATERGADAATAYAGLRGVAGVRALDAANSRAEAATTPY